MDLHDRLDALLTLAEQLGLSIRRESLGGEGGGLCRIKGQAVLFLDTAADLETRYERTLSALASHPGIDRHYLPPEVREDLDRQRGA
ncbi:MAG: hypothetical protein HBSAPP02_00430 [Phycisphaerae bacterium]|nr:MAG: hypothetical protein HRU71_04680 [Planctomycetia bacterium]RIK67565.1 MAG: hypothetical protein DCC66_11635 [Planctomycetota bacterium]GJQ25011.1 MAG: hypothetical protein HBSAPP02_00430 [Phycisphaerae bacterium]